MNLTIDPIQACDFYKVGHKFQYPAGTEEIFSNLTARSNRLAAKVNGKPIQKVINYNLQGFVQWFLQASFNQGFFQKPKSEVIAEYKRRMDNALGPDSVPTDHIEALHDLGYLPVIIKALPEGEAVDMKIPLLTIKNTLPEFFWVTNYLETILSTELWKSITTATVAFEYRKLLAKWAKLTGSPIDFVMWQAHDFSMRGLGGIHDTMTNQSGHLLSGYGTDTIPAMKYLEDFYGGRDTFVGGSVPATEHSVMCAGGDTNEQETIRRIIQDIYPSGVVSVVSDTWDFFHVMTVIAPNLKEVILNRQPNSVGLAKVVFRPDSGDPADIICGDPNALANSPEHKGAIQLLWETFGGTVTETGHRMLNPRVGLIYGDSITLERAEDIMQRLAEKGFASGNVVFGVGSFTYQYATRDTFGMAIKATSAVVNGVRRDLFKDPKTDGGTKKSAKGLLRVDCDAQGNYVLKDQCTEEEEKGGELQVVFENGSLKRFQTLADIRSRIDRQVNEYLESI